MAWAHIQSRRVVQSGSDTSLVAAFTGSITAGSLLVAFFRHGDGAAVTGVSDSVNGAWTQFPTGSPVAGNAIRISAWYFANSAAAPATTTVTATLSASVGGRTTLLAEYSGIATTAPFDVSNGRTMTNPGTGTDAVNSNATATTAENNEMAVCGVSITAAVTLTVGTGFTQRQNGSAVGGVGQVGLEDMNIVSPAAVTGTWTIDSATADSVTIVGVFKEQPAGGGLLVKGGSLTHGRLIRGGKLSS